MKHVKIVIHKKLRFISVFYVRGNVTVDFSVQWNPRLIFSRFMVFPSCNKEFQYRNFLYHKGPSFKTCVS